MESNIRRKAIRARSQRGMSMIELLIAMTVLAVGMGGMVAVFAAAIAGNGKAKFDTAATMLAQEVLERVAAQQQNQAAFPGGPPNIAMTDCNPAGAFAWPIATTPGGALLVPAGQPGQNQGDIDWINQTNAGIAGNYKMLYVACGNNGRQVTYDVRWNVQLISANTRLITVSARPAAAAGGGSATRMYNQPVTLRGIGGQ